MNNNTNNTVNMTSFTPSQNPNLQQNIDIDPENEMVVDELRQKIDF